MTGRTGKDGGVPVKAVRARVLAAAVRIVAEQGAAAATTRAVAKAAGTQSPAIFRLFGDKEGLMDAVAEQTLRDFVADKGGGGMGPDPADDLREGMVSFMSFGIGNPDVFAHMYARTGRQSKAAAIGYAALRERVRRVALTGRLRTSEDRACAIFHGAARGMVLVMLERPPADRAALMDEASRAALDAVLGTGAVDLDAGVAGIAAALGARLDDLPQLSFGERELLRELLERLAAPPIHGQ